MRTPKVAVTAATVVVAAAAAVVVAFGGTGIAHASPRIIPAAAGGAGTPTTASAASPGTKDTIVHLFEWPWASVANECTTVLGPKGFGGVQVSPPQEHVVLPGQGYPWWQDYQPVSYQLTSRRGNRAAFAAMVSTCHAAGVKIYVDAVVNHMAGGASSGTGSGGSAYSHYAYPAVPYGNDDFHHCGRNGNDDIVNYSDKWEVQNCELVDLSDLKTESSYVRGKLTSYLNDLVSLGVDGFRVDAAKHMPAADMAAFIDPVAGDPYVFSEVIEGGSGEPTPEEYTGIGDVTEFRYGDVVGGAFQSGSLSGLNGLAGQMRLASGDAVAFIDNHDTQRNGRAKLTYQNGAPYALAEAFMIAYPYGVPQIMSSFTFSNNDAGPPAASNGTTTAVSCGNGWQCEHRARTTANMVGLRNAAAGAGVTNWWSNGSNQIAFGRGSNAYVAFNRSGSALTRTFQTSLPAGTYCDVMAGDFTNGTCSGPSYAVSSSGQVTATVAANSAFALHINARGGSTNPTGCTSAAVDVEATVSTTFGQNVFVTGNTAALGNWDPNSAVALSSASYPVWKATVTLPGNTSVQYKYIKKEGSTVIWESDPNRTRTTPGTGPCTATWSDSWR
ncbi:carbohydrate-binding module family 20 domain-containing protein [Actinoplanes sp. N902-109]|uniref:carbohydrate-binding module family 20 domain-containing protein n=1 Tax=Actinoplanes sp. (strain N902-109) TaxID=649831 RepID=UPI0003293A77|nr:carbohydrate-binding module family 20 domain-containing protein [Actinoplanes sp. N902-109]AGL18027.1 alpha-amylase [Actinoplanes sp. N902-109]